VRIPFATAAFAVIASVSAACAQTVPNRVLVSGSILTMDQADTVAQVLALDGNRIMAVGPDAQVRALAGPKTQVVVYASDEFAHLRGR
jgi:hypothetical protein